MNMVGTLGKLLLSGAMSRGTGGNVLGSLLGGGAGRQAGGMGGMLGSLLGGQQGGAQQGGAGGMGGMLGSLLGGGAAAGAGAGGLGSLLGQAMGQGQPQAQQPQPSAAQNDQAALLIRAMVNSAKADGQVDQAEQQKIVGQLGDLSAEEAEFIRGEMNAPLDVAGFIRSVPRGMEQQVYLLSLMSVDLDTQAEAQYLDQLAKGLNISEQQSNELHQQVGAPALYS